MSTLSKDSIVNNLYTSCLSNVTIANTKDFLIKKYSETSGNYKCLLSGENKTLFLKATWKRGFIEGPASIISFNGCEVCNFTFRDFTPHGKATFFYNKEPLCTMTIMDGIYMGACEFIRNQCVFYKGDFFHGDVNGEGTLFYSDGTICYKGEFRYGYADGKGTFHDTKGGLFSSDNWKRGRCPTTDQLIVLPPMTICLGQTRDEEMYTEHQIEARLTESLPFLTDFDKQSLQNATALNKDIENTLTDTSETSDTSDTQSDNVIPIPRGELTRHIEEQKIKVDFNDEDIRNLVSLDKKKKLSTKKKTVKTDTTIVQQPVQFYKRPTACVKPPAITVPERFITLVESKEWKTIANDNTDILIESECFNDEFLKYLKFAKFMYLKSLTISDYACIAVTALSIQTCQYLQTLCIGDDCFSPLCIRNEEDYKNITQQIKQGEQGGSFYVSNDYSLQSIEIGKHSFILYSNFTLTLLPTLQSLVIGDFTDNGTIQSGSFDFIGVKAVLLENLPKLKEITIGSYCFTEVHTVVFDNLPSLHSLKLGYHVFRGDREWNQNTMTLTSLPQLTTLIMKDNVGLHMHALTLTNVGLQTDAISYEIDTSFNSQIKVECNNCPDRITSLFQKIKV